jgi:hypothetical protein
MTKEAFPLLYVSSGSVEGSQLMVKSVSRQCGLSFHGNVYRLRTNGTQEKLQPNLQTFCEL